MSQENRVDVNVDELMVQIRQEVRRLTTRRPSQTSTPAAIAVRTNQTAEIMAGLKHSEAVLNLVETRCYSRSKLPDKFQRFPFNFAPTQKVLLKIFNLLFRDQREVNFGLIQASRKTIKSEQQIYAELESVKAQLAQLVARLDAAPSSAQTPVKERAQHENPNL